MTHSPQRTVTTRCQKVDFHFCRQNFIARLHHRQGRVSRGAVTERKDQTRMRIAMLLLTAGQDWRCDLHMPWLNHRHLRAKSFHDALTFKAFGDPFHLYPLGIGKT